MAKEYALSTGNLPLGGLPRNSVASIAYSPDMTSAVDCGCKAPTQPTNDLQTANSIATGLLIGLYEMNLDLSRDYLRTKIFLTREYFLTFLELNFPYFQVFTS